MYAYIIFTFCEGLRRSWSLLFSVLLSPPSGEFSKLQPLVVPLPRLLLCSLKPAAQTESKQYVQIIRSVCFSVYLAPVGNVLPIRGKLNECLSIQAILNVHLKIYSLSGSCLNAPDTRRLLVQDKIS